MEQFINSIIEFILAFREASIQTLGPAIPVLEIIAAVVSGILIWLIIYWVIKSRWHISTSEKWMDMFGVGSVGRRRQLRIWKQILRRIKTQEPNNWKVAILEADRIMDEILKSAGYRQNTSDERFKAIAPGSASNAEQLLEAHRLRNRIAQEPDYVLSHQDAVEILKVYKKAFQEFGLLD